MKTAVYAGSFDPITNGHLWMVREGALLFDKLIVAVGSNPDKRYTFPLASRRRLLEQAVEHMGNIDVAQFENRYLVDFAAEVGADFILRGIRSEEDYEYERRMRHINGDMNPEINTVFLIPSREMAEVSSSFIKGLVGPSGWETVVRRYVPEPVFEELRNWNEQR